MKNFYLLNFYEYPKEIIKLQGLINKKYKDENDEDDENEEEDDDKNENEEDLTKIVIEKNLYSNEIRYLILPFHRFCKNYYTIILSNEKITIKELTNIIYNFYNKKELTLLDLKNLDDGDVYDYIRNITIAKKENPDLIVNPIHIMGDKKFLENITVYEDESGDIQYMLHLGS